MRHLPENQHPWAVASVLAAVAAATIAGTIAEVARRQSNGMAALNPCTPFDPYYDLAEYALNLKPIAHS